MIAQVPEANIGALDAFHGKSKQNEAAAYRLAARLQDILERLVGPTQQAMGENKVDAPTVIGKIGLSLDETAKNIDVATDIAREIESVLFGTVAGEVRQSRDDGMTQVMVGKSGYALQNGLR